MTKPRHRFVVALSVALMAAAANSRATGQTPSASVVIEWRIEAGFAPFGAMDNPQSVSAQWLPARDASGAVESFGSWYRRVSVGGESPFAALLDSARNPWNASTGRYRAEYARPVRTAILVRAHGAGPVCRWSLNGATPQEASGSCDAWVRLEVPLAVSKLSVTSEIPVDPVDVCIDHKVVVALGDSYGSGEGNPDLPTQWKPGAAPPGSYRWLSDPGKEGSLIAAGARWWDTACHRSFWSHQAYVAMGLAAENPHRLVTFLHYSCSAAEVFDGVMVRQHEPPGMDKDCKSLPPPPGSPPNLRNPGCYLGSSQLAAMVSDLCRGTVVDASSSITTMSRTVAERAASDNLHRMDEFGEAGLHLRQCLNGFQQPDLILLSIGGNDIGFGMLAGWAITPSRARSWVGRLFGGWALIRGMLVVCPATGRPAGDKCRRPFDSDLIEQIPTRFELLSQALRSVLAVDPRRVVVTAYPDPLRDSQGQVCKDPPKYHPESPWAGAHTQLPLHWLRRLTRVGLRWDFNIVKDEARILSEYTLPNFRRAIERAAMDEGFQVVSATADAFVGHCWTEQDAGTSPTALPSAEPGQWSCDGKPAGSPACWAPFAPRTRYIRTINDALLTQSSERDDDMTGAVHPTAQGHAAVADTVVGTVRKVPGLVSIR